MNNELSNRKQRKSWAQGFRAQGLFYLPHLASPYKGEGLKKGFGLLEVLLSGLIIIMILGALVSIGHAAVSNNEYAAQRTQAVYLAQEGIEMVRQIRDTNWIDGSNQTTWKSIFFSSGSNYPVERSLMAPSNDISFLHYNNAARSATDLRLGGYVLRGCNSVCLDADVLLAGITYHRIFKTITATDLDVGALIPQNGASSNVYPAQNAMKIGVVVTWNFHGQIKTVEASEILTNWRPDF